MEPEGRLARVKPKSRTRTGHSFHRTTPISTSFVSVGSPATSQETDSCRVGGAFDPEPPPENVSDRVGPAAPVVAVVGQSVTMDILDHDLDRMFHRLERTEERVETLEQEWKDELCARDQKVEDLLWFVSALQGQVSTLTAMVGPQCGLGFVEPGAHGYHQGYPPPGYPPHGFPPRGYPPNYPQGWTQQ